MDWYFFVIRRYAWDGQERQSDLKKMRDEESLWSPDGKGANTPRTVVGAESATTVQFLPSCPITPSIG
jgi:hypothetical protein